MPDNIFIYFAVIESYFMRPNNVKYKILIVKKRVSFNKNFALNKEVHIK